jgi:hypothetical protein
VSSAPTNVRSATQSRPQQSCASCCCDHTQGECTRARTQTHYLGIIVSVAGRRRDRLAAGVTRVLGVPGVLTQRRLRALHCEQCLRSDHVANTRNRLQHTCARALMRRIGYSGGLSAPCSSLSRSACASRVIPQISRIPVPVRARPARAACAAPRVRAPCCAPRAGARSRPLATRARCDTCDHTLHKHTLTLTLTSAVSTSQPSSPATPSKTAAGVVGRSTSTTVRARRRRVRSSSDTRAGVVQGRRDARCARRAASRRCHAEAITRNAIKMTA